MALSYLTYMYSKIVKLNLNLDFNFQFYNVALGIFVRNAYFIFKRTFIFVFGKRKAFYSASAVVVAATIF